MSLWENNSAVMGFQFSGQPLEAKHMSPSKPWPVPKGSPKVHVLLLKLLYPLILEHKQLAFCVRVNMTEFKGKFL